MSKKVILFVLLAVVVVSVVCTLAFCGKKPVETAVDGVVPTASTEPVAESAPVPYVAPQVTVEEAKVIHEEQKKVAEKAKVEEKQAEKEIAKKVVTSSVAVSAPIPDGFPVNNIPIMQGAQIVSASKSESNGFSTYNMVLRVNIPKEDSYKYYFDLYDSMGSAQVTAKKSGESFTIERAKSGLKATFVFENEEDAVSTITIKATL